MVTVYVLSRTTNGKHCVGITANIARRLNEHRAGMSKGGQILGQFRLLHTEEFADYTSARTREKFLKSGQGRKWIKTVLFPYSSFRKILSES